MATLPENNTQYCPVCQYPVYGAKCLQCAEKAERQKRQEMELRYHSAIALGGRRARETYTAEAFKINKVNKQAFEASKNFNPESDNLYLFGPAGSGKSHLATIAARQHLKIKSVGTVYDEVSVNVICTKPTEIFRNIRSAKEAKEEIETIDRYVHKDILIIDDLGVGRDTEFAVTSLFEIIDGRYSLNRGGLIITSNLGLDALSAKLGDDRITSRLAAMCKVFSLEGESDHRIVKN